jgi:hypothetical protein
VLMRMLCLASHMMRPSWWIMPERGTRGNAGRMSIGTAGSTLNLIDTGTIGIQPHDEASTRLAEFDERQTSIVEMRLFGGLSVDETAECPYLAGARAGIGLTRELPSS